MMGVSTTTQFCTAGARPHGGARNAPAMGRADACRFAARTGGNSGGHMERGQIEHSEVAV